jgi:hypothetical protein
MSTEGIPDYLALDEHALLQQCAVDHYRASGPGGQKRNKTDSAVRLRHRPTGVSAHAEESRSQHENKARALRRLRRSIALEVRRPVDVDHYAPSPILRECMNKSGQLIVGRKDHRFPRAIWEILDLLYACDMQLSTAAARLGVSTAHLGNFLGEDPAVWRRVNDMRAAAGLKGLR